MTTLNDRRPKARKTTSISFDRDVIALLDECAASEQRSRSFVTNDRLRRSLKRKKLNVGYITV